MVIQPVFAGYWKMPLQPIFRDAFFPTLFSRNRAAITQVDRLSQTLHYLTHLNQHFSNHWSFDSFVPYTLLAPFDATLAYLGQEACRPISAGHKQPSLIQGGQSGTGDGQNRVRER